MAADSGGTERGITTIKAAATMVGTTVAARPTAAVAGGVIAKALPVPLVPVRVWLRARCKLAELGRDEVGSAKRGGSVCKLR